MEPTGIEPVTSCLQRRRSGSGLSAALGLAILNLRVRPDLTRVSGTSPALGEPSEDDLAALDAARFGGPVGLVLSRADANDALESTSAVASSS